MKTTSLITVMLLMTLAACGSTEGTDEATSETTTAATEATDGDAMAFDEAMAEGDAMTDNEMIDDDMGDGDMEDDDMGDAEMGDDMGDDMGNAGMGDDMGDDGMGDDMAADVDMGDDEYCASLDAFLDATAMDDVEAAEWRATINDYARLLKDTAALAPESSAAELLVLAGIAEEAGVLTYDEFQKNEEIQERMATTFSSEMPSTDDDLLACGLF